MLELGAMRMRIHRHLVDLAGSGLVLIGLLLAAMLVSAVPAVVQTLSRHDVRAHAPGVTAPPLSVPGAAT
jgi:hypothetical protein